MAEDPVRKRTRRAAKRIERQRRKALAARTRKAAEVPRSPAQTPRNRVGRASRTCRLRRRFGLMILRVEPAYASLVGRTRPCRPMRSS
jgi:hypothetical protein